MAWLYILSFWVHSPRDLLFHDGGVFSSFGQYRYYILIPLGASFLALLAIFISLYRKLALFPLIIAMVLTGLIPYFIFFSGGGV
jgi:hypothetical protein